MSLLLAATLAGLAKALLVTLLAVLNAVLALLASLATWKTYLALGHQGGRSSPSSACPFWASSPSCSGASASCASARSSPSLPPPMLDRLRAAPSALVLLLAATVLSGCGPEQPHLARPQPVRLGLRPLWLVLAVLALVDLWKSARTDSDKILWTVVIVIFPFAG